MKRERGFTLIELLTVVALVSIMLAIAVPSFRAFIANYRVTAAANDFLQGITQTRGEALKRGRRVVMVPNDTLGSPTPAGDWKNGWTIFVDFNSNSTFDPATDLVVSKHAALEASTTIADWGGSGAAFTSGGNAFVAFDSTGHPKLPSGALVGGAVFKETPTTTESTRTLCLAAMGSPRVVKGTVVSCS